MSDQRRRAAAVIVGTGIAGLSAAWELIRRGQRDIWVLEAGPRPGGVVQTSAEVGFQMEAGPDSFLTAKPAAAELCAELGLGGELIGTLPSAGAWVHHRGRLRPLPAGWRWAAPTRLWPLLRSPLFSVQVKAEVAARWARTAPPRADESAAAYLRRRFGARAGQALAETVAGPLLAGVYGGDVEQLAAAEMRGGGSARSKPRHGGGPASATTFTSLQGGMEALVRSLAAHLPAGTLRLNCRATAVLTGAGGFQLTLEQGEMVETARLILATPAWAAAELVRGLDGGLAAELAAIPYASSVNVNVAYDRAPELPRGHGFLVSRQEGRQLLACTFVHQKFAGRVPAGGGLIRLFYGEAVAAWPEARVEALALDELRALLGVGAAPRLAVVRRWPRAMAQYQPGHGARLQAIAAACRRHPGLALAGNAYAGIGVPDCINSGRAAARAVGDRVG